MAAVGTGPALPDALPALFLRCFRSDPGIFGRAPAHYPALRRQPPGVRCGSPGGTAAPLQPASPGYPAPAGNGDRCAGAAACGQYLAPGAAAFCPRRFCRGISGPVPGRPGSDRHAGLGSALQTLNVHLQGPEPHPVDAANGGAPGAGQPSGGFGHRPGTHPAVRDGPEPLLPGGDPPSGGGLHGWQSPGTAAFAGRYVRRRSPAPCQFRLALPCPFIWCREWPPAGAGTERRRRFRGAPGPDGRRRDRHRSGAPQEITPGPGLSDRSRSGTEHRVPGPPGAADSDRTTQFPVSGLGAVRCSDGTPHRRGSERRGRHAGHLREQPPYGGRDHRYIGAPIAGGPPVLHNLAGQPAPAAFEAVRPAGSGPGDPGAGRNGIARLPPGGHRQLECDHIGSFPAALVAG